MLLSIPYLLYGSSKHPSHHFVRIWKDGVPVFRTDATTAASFSQAKISARLRHPIRRSPMGRNIFDHARSTSLRIKDDSEDIDVKIVFVPQTLTRIGRHAHPP